MPDHVAQVHSECPGTPPAPRSSNQAADLMREVAAFRAPSRRRSLLQLADTALPFLALCGLMSWTVDRSYALTLLLAVLAAGLTARLFIIQHDCGHGSFFRSRLANDVLGHVIAIVTLTPYLAWRWSHAVHHAKSGSLQDRGFGYFELMTTAEYRAATPFQRFRYRVYRNPFVLLGLGPPLQFFVLNRFSPRGARPSVRRSVHVSNLLLLLSYAGLGFALGFRHLLMIEVPIVAFTSILGVWLFFVQHHFEGAYWEAEGDWQFARAALQGSSYLPLPRVLQWFTGNIGFHHVHHLDARIPNYRLEACHLAVPALREVKPLTLRDSMHALTRPLWDEERKDLVGYALARVAEKASVPVPSVLGPEVLASE